MFYSQENDRRKKEEAKNQKTRKPNILDSAGDDEGVLDGLMQALETGSAFRDPSRPGRRRAPRKGMICLWLVFNSLNSFIHTYFEGMVCIVQWILDIISNIFLSSGNKFCPSDVYGRLYTIHIGQNEFQYPEFLSLITVNQNFLFKNLVYKI